MTTRGIEEDPKAVASDETKLNFSKQAIRAVANDSADQVHFREYDAEFRVPIILVDKKYCFLTLRLTPDQAPESIRIELADPSEGTRFEQNVAQTLKSLSLFLSPSTQVDASVESCERHFEEIWKRSKPFD